MVATQALLVMGGNSADTPELMARALQLASESVGRITAVSQSYVTRSWGFEADDFCNRAVEIETRLSPEELLDALQAIERELGRDRCAEAAERAVTGQRYASRPIDIDIIYYGDEVLSSARLTIPHPARAARRFVLEPLAEIAGTKVDPQTGESVCRMFLRLKEKEKEQ